MSETKLHRYWFQFDNATKGIQAHGLTMGCGITALSKDDALSILQESVLNGDAMPPILSFEEGIDVSILDENHVLPNMAPPNSRGVWFPLGYQ